MNVVDLQRRKPGIQELKYLLKATWVVRSGIRDQVQVDPQACALAMMTNSMDRQLPGSLPLSPVASHNLSWASRRDVVSAVLVDVHECHQGPIAVAPEEPHLDFFLIWIPSLQGTEINQTWVTRRPVERGASQHQDNRM